MDKILRFHYLWILVWILIIGAAVVDIFESSSILDFLTIIFGVSMIYYNYDNYRKSYRKMIPKNGKNGKNGENGDIPYG